MDQSRLCTAQYFNWKRRFMNINWPQWYSSWAYPWTLDVLKFMQKSCPPCQRGSFELQHMLWLLRKSVTGRRLSSKGSNSYISLVTWPFLKEAKVRVFIFRLINTIPKTTVDTREELLVTETSSRNLRVNET